MDAYMTPTGYAVTEFDIRLSIPVVGWFSLEDWMPVLEAFYTRIKGHRMEEMPQFIEEIESNFDEFPMHFTQEGANVGVRHKPYYGMVRKDVDLPTGVRIVRPWMRRGHLLMAVPASETRH